MATIIKLDKNEEIAQVIQRIKNLRERDVVFEVDKGSVILTNSANLRLMRKTAEVLGKNIQLKTDDEMGQVLANKAGLPLFGQKQAKVPKTVRPVSKQPATKTSKPRFSDIKAKSRVKPAPAAQQVSDEEVEFTQPDLQDDIVVPMPNPPASIKKATVTPRPVIPPVTIPRSTPGPKASTPSRWKFGRDYSKVFILTAIILVVAVFGLAVLLPKAEITVYARSEPVTRDLEISVDRNAKGIDHTKLIIPGEVITKELSHTKTFQTSGIKKVGEKATGSVVIYNFTKNTLTLRASTTTLLINGKKYFFTRDATGIRPTATIGSGNDQEVDRTSLTAPVPIIADQAGEEYNLPVNQKIQIQNTALGDNPSVYAMNEVAFTGGSAKNVPILSQADIDRATQQMTDELATIAEDEVSTGDDSDKKVLPTGSIKEVLAKTANKNVGDEASEFDMTIIGRLTGLAYNEDDIKNLVTEKINAVLTTDKYLIEDGRKEVTAKFKTLDMSKGLGVLSVHFETLVAYRVNSDDMAKVLAGKDALEIKEILLTKPEIDRVDVRFSPFFVNKAPRFNGKIYIKTRLTQI